MPFFTHVFAASVFRADPGSHWESFGRKVDGGRGASGRAMSAMKACICMHCLLSSASKPLIGPESKATWPHLGPITMLMCAPAITN